MIKGKIIDIAPDGMATIQATVPLQQFVHRQVKEVAIELLDSRSLSDKQRRCCYALIKEIADWSGETTEGAKTTLKLDFLSDRVDAISTNLFSLSNAPMSLIADFQKYLINLILEYDIPTKAPLWQFADDINHYVYLCVIRKKCAVCGKHCDLHHLNGSTVGMGNNRNEVEHLGREVMSLCRSHHNEAHTIGQKEFFEKYHFDKGVIVDKNILKLYKLKR